MEIVVLSPGLGETVLFGQTCKERFSGKDCYMPARILSVPIWKCPEVQSSGMYQAQQNLVFGLRSKDFFQVRFGRGLIRCGNSKLSSLD